MPPLRVLLLLACALPLAGCADTGDAAPDAPPAVETAAADAPAPPEAVPLPAAEGAEGPQTYAVTLFFNGTLTGAGGRGRVCQGDACVNGARHAFDADNRTRAILAELRWTGAWDLDLGLSPETASVPITEPTAQPQGTTHRDDDGLPGAPDSVARILVDDPAELAEPMEWRVSIAAKAAAEAPYELAVTLFYGGAPPADFTALPPA